MASNCGAFLQAYALKSHLESRGHQVVHVEYRSTRSNRKPFYRIRPGKHDLTNPLEHWRSLNFGRQKYALFKRDLESFTVVEPREAARVDAVVLGSDEIWNVRNPMFQDPIFFGHGLENVIAYAPSVGASTLDDYARHKERLHDILRLQAVSARDRSTASLVEAVTSEAPPIVVDPTLLQTWERSRNEALNVQRGDRYLLVYAYSPAHVPIEELRAFARTRKLRLVSACFRHDWCDQSVNCSPLEFLSMVDGAEYVFTTTFHGAIFAILHKKPFACKVRSPKTSDLLMSLGLGSRMISSDGGRATDGIAGVLESPTAYDPVFETIRQMRSTSQAYLEQALSSVTAHRP